MPTSARPFRPGLVVLALATLVAASPVAARERPGTPSHVAMTLAGPDRLRMTWINTRRVGQDGGFTERTYFDVEGQTDPSRPEFGANPILGQTVTYDIAGLAAGRHCFRAWSREGPNGVRSEVPSAWACGTVPGPQPPGRTGASPQVGAVLSNQHLLVWVAPMLCLDNRQQLQILIKRSRQKILTMLNTVGEQTQEIGTAGTCMQLLQRFCLVWTHQLYQQRLPRPLFMKPDQLYKKPPVSAIYY